MNYAGLFPKTDEMSKNANVACVRLMRHLLKNFDTLADP